MSISISRHRRLLAHLWDTSFRPASHLCLLQTDDELTEFLLSNRLSVQDLWALREAPLHQIGALRPRRLYCIIKDIFDPRPVDFARPLFSQITHLEIFDDPGHLSDGGWSSLALIPNLTHLAFNDNEFIPLLPKLLCACASLRGLALVMPEEVPQPLHEEVSDQLARDTRFLWISNAEYIRDWHQGALTGEDYWSRAGQFIERRKGNVTNLLD
ncbi:hypothetical protein FB45DRAFT_906633 [Roridomyces roridus]|uniref:Uncharacterized protein n=1 Tax=Roridomyces roridus TaxID=1738132 RepID=A0AAD7FPP1_9AGAR|nr:hypothetical protein FB45DRAFT_906633 [Roridomyces roridus]